MEYLSVILIITVCSLLHDGDYASKGVCVALHAALSTGAMYLCDNGMWGWLAALASVGIFWGVFRRGWQAKAELTGIRLKTREAILGILKAYPKAFEYLPRLITKWVVKMPYPQYHRRIQSGLIAILCTAPISAIPVLVTGAVYGI